jgi:GNAT superfamily N-acetyltransferase
MMRIRTVEPGDMRELMQLIEAHARFERADPPRGGAAGRLERALFGSAPRLFAWVAQVEQSMVGYATATLDYSTWSGEDYLHMDCLFVSEAWRGQRIGERLLHTVAAHARCMGCAQMQWQTPSWNADAVRFYLRAGGVGSDKVRFHLSVES